MARQLKAPGSDSDSVSSPNSSGRMSKSQSPKLIERGSSRNTPTEKSCTGKISELESQLALFRDELKKGKEQFIATDTEKKQAQQEAEETKQQSTAISTKLEEAIHRQHSIYSNALASAMNEIQKLKKQLADSEMKKSKHADSAYVEIQSLWVELSETLVLLQKMKHRLNDQKESEACALKVASEAEQHLKEIKAAAETFRSHGLKAKEAYDSLAVELGKSNAEVNSLEMLASKLRANITGPSGDGDNDHSKNQVERLRAEIVFLKNEVCNIKSDLEESDMRCEGEYKQSRWDIGHAYTAVQCAKIESAVREAELKGELRDAISTIRELKSELTCTMNKSKTDPMEYEFKLEEWLHSREFTSDLKSADDIQRTSLKGPNYDSVFDSGEF